jgi:tetratricopeptide (TPR) repeat protein
VKLIRNLPELRFEGRIHEQVLPAINRLGGTVAWTDIFVLHSGSDHSAEGQAKKLARDLALLTLEEAERPDHPFTLFNLGMTYLEMKRYEEAARYLRRTLANAGPQESHVPKAFSLLIQALSEQGQLNEAQAQCDEGLERYPDDPELIFRAGVLAQHAGRHCDAERYYRTVLEGAFAPRFRSIDRGILGYKTQQNLACLHADQGRHAEAEYYWRRILADRPDYVVAWIGLVSSLLKQNKIAEARTVIANSEILRRNRSLRKQLEANLHQATGNPSAAQRLLQEAVATSPDDLELRDALCRHLFEHAALEEAESALETLVEKSPNNAAALYNLATVRLRRGQYEAAVESYKSSLTLRPNWPPAYSHLATCYERLGRIKEAAGALEKANGIAS